MRLPWRSTKTLAFYMFHVKVPSALQRFSMSLAVLRSAEFRNLRSKHERSTIRRIQRYHGTDDMAFRNLWRPSPHRYTLHILRPQVAHPWGYLEDLQRFMSVATLHLYGFHVKVPLALSKPAKHHAGTTGVPNPVASLQMKLSYPLCFVEELVCLHPGDLYNSIASF